MALKGVDARSRGTDHSRSPQPLSEGERKDIAKIVYHELHNATEPLTTAQLRDRTLLPVHEVRQAIDALMERGLCTDRQPRTSRQSTRYLAIHPSSERHV